MKKGLLIVISGPSGSGKTTVCRELVRSIAHTQFSISATTRKRRKGEVHGRDYYFISLQEFSRKVKQAAFLEWAKVYDHYYGTLKKPALDCLKAGRNVLLDIDMQGALQIKKQFPRALLIFILPPGLAELKKRLFSRKRESAELIGKRLKKIEDELAYISRYDFIVINDTLPKTISAIKKFIKNKEGRHNGTKTR